jgi:hypothetical protein
MLTVVDDDGLSDSDIVNVHINYENNLPIADAGEDQVVTGNSQVKLDGSDSYDDKEIAQYVWTQIGGESFVTLIDRRTAKPFFTAPTFKDVLVFELVVFDEQGLQSFDEVIVSVEGVIPDKEDDKGLCFINSLGQ